ncbi:hypothetical protein [Rhodococcus globerulus]
MIAHLKSQPSDTAGGATCHSAATNQDGIESAQESNVRFSGSGIT